MHFISVLASLIFHKYNIECYYHLTESSEHFQIENTQCSLINIKDIGNFVFNKFDVNTKQCDTFLFVNINTSKDAFITMEKFIRKENTIQFNERKYLVFLSSNESVTNFFQNDELKYISNLLVIKTTQTKSNGIEKSNHFIEADKEQNMTETYEIYTNKFVGQGQEEPILLDVWFSHNRSFLADANLFPDKLSNQMGRAFRISTTLFVPYSYLAKLKGRHLQLCIEFAKKHNMTYTVEDILGIIKELNENGTGSGPYYDLVTDKLDILIRPTYFNINFKKFYDNSLPISRGVLVLLVPKPSTIDGWSILLNIFGKKLWIFLIVTCITLSVLIEIDRKLRKRNQLQSYYWIGTLFGQGLPSNEIPNDHYLRIPYAFWLLMMIILSTSFNARYATKIIIPTYANELFTVKDFVNSGLIFMSEYPTIADYLAADERPYYRKLGKLHRTRKHAFINEKAANRSVGVVAELSITTGYISTFMTEEIAPYYKVLPEPFLEKERIFVLRKHSVYTPLIDQFIIRVMDVGLMEKWTSDCVLAFNKSRRQLLFEMHNHNQYDRTVQLTLPQLLSTFSLLCGGLICSLVVFTIELLIGRVHIRKHNR